MGAYETFAGVYDILMGDTDYNGWSLYIKKIWRRYGINPRLILDLACGTGSLSVILAKEGYEVIGVDSSADMLSVADKKAKNEGLDILFLNQKMQQLELYGTVDCIVCVFDSINYIMRTDELLGVFKRVNNYLNKGGLFIFDINTPYKYRSVLGEGTFAENFEGCSYIWENHYDEKRRINEYALNLFLESDGGLYKKITEYHYQRAYCKRTIVSLLKKAGLTLEGVFDAYAFNKPGRASERIFFIARGFY